MNTNKILKKIKAGKSKNRNGEILKYKPFVSIKGEDILNALLINGKFASFDTNFSDDEIYVALQKCKDLIRISHNDSDILCNDISPLSARQFFCSEAAIKLIMDNEYNSALHELEDCIDDYGKSKSRYVTRNELILYNCILTCFISKLKNKTVFGNKAIVSVNIPQKGNKQEIEQLKKK